MEWRPVKGYEGVYEVNVLGEVRNTKKKNAMAQTVGKIGYPVVSLNKNNKQTKKTVHRILAIAFLPNPLNLPTVNHIDGNKQNNDITNLEWASYSENNKHAYENGLKEVITSKKRIAAKPIIAVNLKTYEISEFKCAIDAIVLGISTASIYRVLHGKQHSTKGYFLKYKEATK